MAGNVPLREALAKKGKGGLTLAQLAGYDDLITDALVDQVCRRRDLALKPLVVAPETDIDRTIGVFLDANPQKPSTILILARPERTSHRDHSTRQSYH